MIHVSVDSVGATSLDRVNKVLAGVPGGAIKAASSALKRAGESAKTKSGQFAAAQYTISKGTFMSHVSMKTQLSGGFGGVVSMRISFAGSPLPLRTFNVRYSRGGALTAQVLRNSGGGVLARAFVAQAYGMAVMRRMGPERLPIEALYGPGTSKMMGNEEVVQKMDEEISKTFESRLEHEILRVLSGY